MSLTLPLAAEAPRKPNLFGLTLTQLQEELAPIVPKKYQVASLYKALYQRCIRSFEDCTDLKLETRAALAEKYDIRWLAVEAAYPSSDGTVRFLLTLEDGKSVEGVYIPDGERVTFCLSSQVGCALACSFCMTGKLGFIRNLTPAEILGGLWTMRYEMREQMSVPTGFGIRDSGFGKTRIGEQWPIARQPEFGWRAPKKNVGAADTPPNAKSRIPNPDKQFAEPNSDTAPAQFVEKPFNIVFMGQGEPFLNRKNLWAALDILTDPDGGQISWRRVTVSTAGILDGIKEWATMERRPRLAISLTTAIPEQRNELMPVNETFPIGEIAAFLRTVEWRSNERVFFEFPLLKGINTSPRHVNALAKLVDGIPCKFNLIPWNPAPELPLVRPDDAEVSDFQERLFAKGFTVTVRKSKGVDIFGACGQLHALHSADKSALPVRKP